MSDRNLTWGCVFSYRCVVLFSTIGPSQPNILIIINRSFNQKGGLIWIHFKVLVDKKLPFKFVLNWFKILNNLKNHLIRQFLCAADPYYASLTETFGVLNIPGVPMLASISLIQQLLSFLQLAVEWDGADEDKEYKAESSTAQERKVRVDGTRSSIHTAWLPMKLSIE